MEFSLFVHNMRFLFFSFVVSFVLCCLFTPGGLQVCLVLEKFNVDEFMDNLKVSSVIISTILFLLCYFYTEFALASFQYLKFAELSRRLNTVDAATIKEILEYIMQQIPPHQIKVKEVPNLFTVNPSPHFSSTTVIQVCGGQCVTCTIELKKGNKHFPSTGRP